MATPDPFAAIRDLAAARPAPEARDRERERAAQEAVRQALAQELEGKKLLYARAAFIHFCNDLVSSDKCPFRYEVDPLLPLAAFPGLHQHFSAQLCARGFTIRRFLEFSRVELLEPNPSIPTPDLPDQLTIAAHKVACEQWKAKASARFITTFAAQARAGVVIFDCVKCDGVDYELISYMNEHLAKLPFESDGKRSILVTHPVTSTARGIYDPPETYAISATIRDAIFKE